MVKIDITLTFSKLMSLILLICGTGLTLYMKDLTPFSLVVPFCGAMIIGKQFLDKGKNKTENNVETQKT